MASYQQLIFECFLSLRPPLNLHVINFSFAKISAQLYIQGHVNFYLFDDCCARTDEQIITQSKTLIYAAKPFPKPLLPASQSLL